MIKKLLSIFLVCVTLIFGVGQMAFAKVSVSDVKNFVQSSGKTDSVTLKWDKVKNADGYRLYLYDSSSEEYKKSGDYKDTAVTIASLSAGKSYKFRIKAYTKEGDTRVYSKNYVKLTAVTAPQKIEDVKTGSVKEKSFTLSWSRSKGADGYLVQKLGLEDDKWKTVKTTTEPFCKLTKEGRYRVLAYKLSGEKKICSEASNKVTGKLKYVASKSGTFTFTVYGYGHGVGMSQMGAMSYAKDGWSYKKILTHYYSGTKVVTDEKTPKKVKYAGEEYKLKEYLYRITQAEIGGGAPEEAIKAQVVACYSYAKYKNFDLKSYDHAFSAEDKVQDSVKKAVNAVLGKYVSYNGKVCLTPYFTTSAGKTADGETVWGTNTPYLKAVDSRSDRKNAYWKSTYSISSKDFKNRFLEDFDIKLSGDPAKWIKIISKDNAVSSSIGYVKKITVGDKSFSGESFRAKVMHYSLRSNCYTFTYKPDPVKK